MNRGMTVRGGMTIIPLLVSGDTAAVVTLFFIINLLTKLDNWVIIKLSLTSEVKTVEASNHSPLLKGSQKTKGTIWKPLIAISSLSVFSFISGQYLPYVIIAVSGSGAIAAVPLAIFAVSAVVALISTIYLIRLAVSRADSKKEAGLDGEELGHIASQEPQKFVCENCTSLENKSSVSAPPPPPPPFGAPPPPPSLGDNSPSGPTTGADMFAEIKNIKLKKTDSFAGESGNGEGSTPLCKEILSNARTPMTQEDSDAFDAKIKESRKQKLEEKSTNPNASQIALILARRLAIEPSDSESEHSDSISDSGWTTDESKDKQKEIEQKKKVLAKSRKKSTPSNSQSFHKERSESPDSGNVSGDDVHSKLTSPSPPEPKAEKPLISPKPVGFKNKPEAPPAAQVNNDPVKSEVQEPSILSVKDRVAELNARA